MLIERKVIKSFRREATIIFLIIAIAAYALVSSVLSILVVFVGFLVALSLLKPQNIIYTLQLDGIGFCFRVNQQVKYQFNWSEVETVTVEAEHRGWQYEVTLFLTNSTIGKTLPIYLTNQEANTLRIIAAKWPEAKTKIEVRL